MRTLFRLSVAVEDAIVSAKRYDVSFEVCIGRLELACYDAFTNHGCECST